MSLSTELAKEQLRKIVELFSSQELPQVSARKFMASLDIPSTRWSLGNHLLMWLAGTEDGRGYRQWQEIGRYVKKGASAFHILGPLITKKMFKDEATGEEKEESLLVGFKAIPVFRMEDTDGQPLPEPKPRIIPPLLDVAEKWGVKVKYRTAWIAPMPTAHTATMKFT